MHWEIMIFNFFPLKFYPPLGSPLKLQWDENVLGEYRIMRLNLIIYE